MILVNLIFVCCKSFDVISKSNKLGNSRNRFFGFLFTRIYTNCLHIGLVRVYFAGVFDEIYKHAVFLLPKAPR